MKTYSLLLVALLLTLIAGITQAYTLAEFKFDNEAQEQAFRELTGELRCLVCQNESLAASDADLAQDLRQEVYEMMQAGKTKDDIVEFLVARYGDFVLYEPPLKPSTYLLWFGPFILLAIAAGILYRTVRRKKRTRETQLSEQEQARLQKLLSDTSKTSDDNL